MWNKVLLWFACFSYGSAKLLVVTSYGDPAEIIPESLFSGYRQRSFSIGSVDQSQPVFGRTSRIDKHIARFSEASNAPNESINSF